MKVYAPNESGNTMVIVRWLIETPDGWIGAWDRPALDRVAEDEALIQQALEALEAANGDPVWPKTLKEYARVPQAVAALRDRLGDTK